MFAGIARGRDRRRVKRLAHHAAVGERDVERRLQRVQGNQPPVPLNRHRLAEARHQPLGGGVLILLVAEAAEEAAAGAGDPRRVDRQVLLLRHPMDVVGSSCSHDEQHSSRPQRPRPPTTLAWSRKPICRSSMRVRNVGQVAHQGAEVDPPLGDELEGEAAAVEVVLGADELHRQPVHGHPRLAARQRVRLPR